MTTRERFNAADFCMELACTPRHERPALIGDDPRRQRIAEHFLAVAAQAPTPGPEQRAIVRSVFRKARLAAEQTPPEDAHSRPQEQPEAEVVGDA